MFRGFRHPLGRPRGLFSLTSTFEVSFEVSFALSFGISFELLFEDCEVISPRTCLPSLPFCEVDPS